MMQRKWVASALLAGLLLVGVAGRRLAAQDSHRRAELADDDDELERRVLRSIRSYREERARGKELVLAERIDALERDVERLEAKIDRLAALLEKGAAPTAAAEPRHPRGRANGEPTGAPAKTLAFEAPAAWTRLPAKGAVKGQYRTEAAEGEKEGGTVQVRLLGPKASWDRQLDFYCSHFEDQSGKKLDKAQLKTETLEAGGLTIEMAELAGTFVSGEKHEGADKDDAGGSKKPGQRTIGCYVDGPGGGWAIALWGPEKSVAKARPAFLAFVKSVKLVDRPPGGEDAPQRRHRDDDDD